MNRLILSILSLFISFTAFSQSENGTYIQYDSIIKFSGNAPGYGGQYQFNIHVVRNPNYFTTDTTSRPVLISMPGLGEISTDTTTLKNNAHLYGPVYWMDNGWDGGITLGNGKHFPIYIVITVNTGNGSVPRPQPVIQLLDSLKKWFHPRGGKFQWTGLSAGGFTCGEMLTYNDGTGASTLTNHAQTLIGSFLSLEGNANSSSVSQSDLGWGAFGGWAKYNNGRYMAFEGTADTRNLWISRDTMSNVGYGSLAYFTYQNYGGGGHCCWNSIYDPSQTDFQCVSPITNSYIQTNKNHANSMGTYIGGNVFSWMLRQGDTTLIGSSVPTVSTSGNQSFYLPQNSTTITGTATAASGYSISSATWTQLSGPNTSTMATSGSASSFVLTASNLISGTYTFQYTAIDNGSHSNSINVTVTVLAEVSPTVSAGSDQTIILPVSSLQLNGSASGNGGATISSTVWTQTSGPNTATFSNTTIISPTVSNLIAGTYIFKLTATDNNGNSNSASVSITVTPANTQYVAPIQVYTGEYLVGFIDKNGLPYGMSDNLNLIGSGGTGTAGIPNRFVTSPTTLKMKSGAAGLHQIIFIDTAGYAWGGGENSQGQLGNGTLTSPILTPQKITTDSSGNTFGNISQVFAAYAGNAAQSFYFLKGDGTLWMVGDTRCGMRGDGSYGDTTTRPIQLTIPGNRTVIQVVTGKHTTILCSDSTVWSCGGGGVSSTPNYQNLGYSPTTSATDYLTWHQVTGFNAGVAQIQGGDSWNYAITSTGKLYGWGFYAGYMGNKNNGIRYATPTDLTDSITAYLKDNNGNQLSIKQMTTNSNCTHVIASDGSLWGWGDNAQGNIGNGVELDYSQTTNPYSWDFNALDLAQTHPVRISGKKGYATAFGGQTFTYMFYAEDSSGNLYSCGRNKNAVMGNGIIGCSSNQRATYPNSWDVPWLTPVNPFTLTGVTTSTSPQCITSSGSTYCSECTVPTITLTANAGSTQNISTLSTQLDGSGSTASGGVIAYYLWTQVSGPSTAIFDFQSTSKPTITSLTNGTYIFNLKVTDNAWNTATAQVTVNVGGVPCNCIICNNCILK